MLKSYIYNLLNSPKVDASKIVRQETLQVASQV